MKSYYKEYCRKLLDTYNLQKDRTIVNSLDKEWFVQLTSIKDNHAIKQHIISHFDSIIDDYHLYKEITSDDIVLRFNNNDKYNLGWHQDNRILQKQNVYNRHKIHDLEIIKEDDKYIYGIWCQKTPPEKTVLIYLSTYGEDFFGAELQLLTSIDGEYATIYPKKGDVISFDGRELHRVQQLHKGDRKCIVIKLRK